MYLFINLIALCGVAFILGSKVFEIKSGKISPMARLSASADPVIRKKIDAGKELVARFNKSNFERFFRFALVAVFHAFGVAGLFVSRHYKKFMARVRGRKSLKTGGIVSFFLKNVAESKGEEEKKL